MADESTEYGIFRGDELVLGGFADRASAEVALRERFGPNEPLYIEAVNDDDDSDLDDDDDDFDDSDLDDDFDDDDDDDFDDDSDLDDSDLDDEEEFV